MTDDNSNMAAVGNYANRNERASLKDYNDAWRSVRRQAIEKSQALRSELSGSIFTTSVETVQQQTVNSLQGSYSSTATAMARLNILV